MSKDLVVLKDISRTYQKGKTRVEVLHRLNLNIAEVDFLALMGPSGSGKTTLLNLLGALDQPDCGEVWVDGENVVHLSRAARADLRLRHVGFVFQAYNLVPVLSALENAEFILLLQGVPRTERRRRVRSLFARMGLAGLEGRRPHELSGGQQQRVAVARAIAATPALVLADEPTANLDSATGADLLGLMEGLNRELGITFVFSTHDPQVMAHARRRIQLRDGRIAEDTRVSPGM